MSAPAPLSDTATLGELLLEEALVNLETPGQVVVKQLEQRQRLPGVVVVEHGELVGLVSRRQLYQGLSQPYALEIFLRRPIRVFLDLTPNCYQPLVVDYRDSVSAGVHQALARPAQVLFEPLIIRLAHPRLPCLQSYFLLDFHTLMLAHAQISAAVNRKMKLQQQQLQQEQATVQRYTTQLESQQQLIQARNRQLEQQQQRMATQAQAIHTLNQHFMQIGTLLSKEGKKAFQATFAGVNAICQQTDQITTVGQRLETELKTIEDTSQVIEQISCQVHHLSDQAAVLTQQAREGDLSQALEGLGAITEEIRHLSQQTAHAGHQVKALGDRFCDRITAFQASAHRGTVTARSLIREIEQAAIALSELENLVQRAKQSPADIGPTAADAISGDVEPPTEKCPTAPNGSTSTVDERKNILEGIVSTG
ncbi:MAG: hypothetical protein AAFU71_04205 [Cyanobacteria bacterium J06632_22]